MADPQTEVYTIFCVVLGEITEFSVKIARNETVDDLKKAIKATKPNRFVDIDADQLAVYRVEISGSREARMEELERMAGNLDQQEELDPLSELTEIFSIAPRKKTIHLIVQSPKPGPRGLKRQTSSEQIMVAAKRRRLYEDSVSNVAPSAFGGQETYKRLDQTKFALNRPPVSETVPLAISHPIFGEFVEEAKTYIPTATDNALVRDLRNVMSKTYDLEADYCNEFRRVLCQHYTEVQLEPAHIGSTRYVSDGHLRVGEFMSSVCEGKLWKGTGDPEVQAVGYLIASVRQSFRRAGDCPDKFPCMIIYIFGSFICFAGAVLTDRLHLETLTTAFPMHTNHHEGQIAAQAASTLGAFRQALQKLKVHYTKLHNPTAARKKEAPFADKDYEGLIYPYICHYSDKDGTTVEFQYIRRLYANKLLFLCQATSGLKLCVKFTRRYSEKAHRHCADRGVAPGLYKVQTLPGGWTMVVMQYLDNDIYKPLLAPELSQALLAKEVRRVVGVLHEGEFVHGDVRGVNLMVYREPGTTGEEQKVLLVDFDWAGEAHKICYPPNVNCEIYRPPGARDGEVITREHDMAMVDNMFKHLRDSLVPAL